VQLVFIYGQPATGKLTIARELAKRTGLPVFHNHLIVDAVAAVFPFASEEFVRLRERFWLETIATAARAGASLIFTFAPESTVSPTFPRQVMKRVAAAGGRTRFIALTLAADKQDERLANAGRSEFGKLRSLEILHDLRTDFAACLADMPQAELTIDTGELSPSDAAALIAEVISA
jgi:hypothetical protein